MGAKLGTSGVMADMNLTPLIDIVLVVLIIMMVSIPIQIEQMGVKLPGRVEVQSKTDVPVEQLVIALYPDGGLALNRKLMTEEALFAQVTRRLRPMEKKSVFIDAHPDVIYARVIDMMDLAREAGASQVGLARLKPEGPLAATSVEPGSTPRGVSLGAPNVVGAITDKKAEAAYLPHTGAIEACYLQGLARRPDLTGRLIVRITLGPEGQHMSEGVISSTLEDPGVEGCIAALLPTIAYAPLGPDKTAIVQYPLLFSPG